MTASNEELMAWLDDAARYFEARDTHGEDQAHWANVFNAETCRKIKVRLAAQSGGEVALIPTTNPEQCPKCGGDCSAANPPVFDCPMIGCNRDF